MAVDSELKARSLDSAMDLASAPPLANGVHPPKKNRGLRELVGLSDGSGIQLNESRTRHAGAKPTASGDQNVALGTKAMPGKARLASASQLAVSSSRGGKRPASSDKQEAVDSPPMLGKDGRPEIVQVPLVGGQEAAAATEAAAEAGPLAEEPANSLPEAAPFTAADALATEVALSEDEVSQIASRAVANAAGASSAAPEETASPSRKRGSAAFCGGALPPPSPAASSPRRAQRSGAADAVQSSLHQPMSETAAPPSPQRSDRSGAAPLPPPSPQRSVRSAARRVGAVAAAGASGLSPIADIAKFVHADDDMSDVTDASAVPRAARSNIDRRPASNLQGASLHSACGRSHLSRKSR